MNYLNIILLDSVGSKLSIIQIAPAILGALIGSYLTRLLNRNREKTTLSFELHKEYNSYEMNLHRRNADKFLKQYPKVSYEELGNLKNDEVPSVFVVLSFFQRLSQGVKYNQLKKKIILDLFSEPFYYWYYISYKDNLVPLENWNASEQISFLFKWFQKKLTSEKHNTLKSEMVQKNTDRTN